MKKQVLGMILLTLPCMPQAKDTFPVGSIIQSLLTVEKFQEKMGAEWRPMDGSNIQGTALATDFGSPNLPNAEGKFLRMRNGVNTSCSNPNNCQFDPDGRRELGSYQADLLKSHNHSYTNPEGGGHVGHFSPSGWEGTRGAGTSHTGGAETRPKNIAVNFFVKVDNCRSKNCK
jgi:hypothetical protein